MVQSMQWHDRCLLTTNIRQHNDKLMVVSAATDGRIAIWHLSQTSDVPVYVIDGAHASGVTAISTITRGKSKLKQICGPC